MTIQDVILTLVGPSGRYLRGLWDPHDILANLLWSSDIAMSRTVATQIINGQRNLSPKYTRPYLMSNSIDLLEEDLCAFAAHYHSRALLTDIQIRIRMAVVASDWSPDQIAALDAYYIADNPSRDQIAVYIAHVMYAIICM